MNDQCGILLLDFEFDPRSGNVRLTGTSRNNNYSGGGGGGYRPPSNPDPNGSELGPAIFAAFIAFCVSLFFNLNIVLSLIIAAVVGFYAFKSKKDS